MNHQILRLPDVKKSTGSSRSTIYARIAENTFPELVSLGGRAVGWLEAEVQEWSQRRNEASRNVTTCTNEWRLLPNGAIRAVDEVLTTQSLGAC